MARRKSSSDHGSPPRPPGGPSKPGSAKPNRAFDVWLDRGLHEIFDKVINDPVPEDLLKLLGPDGKE